MKTILLVDDEPDIRLMSKYMLEANGYAVREAPDGPSCLLAMREERPDLVLLDIRMPGPDGWTVLKEILDDPELADVPVVMASAHASPTDAELASLKGRAGYVVKPFREKELLAALEVLD